MIKLGRLIILTGGKASFYADVFYTISLPLLPPIVWISRKQKPIDTGYHDMSNPAFAKNQEGSQFVLDRKPAPQHIVVKEG